MNRERSKYWWRRPWRLWPPEFQERLENIDVVVDDFPSNAQLRHSNLGRGYTLLGLYEESP